MEVVTHSVIVDAHSHLATLIPNGKLINSVHHQGIKQLAPTLRASSWSPDSVIESIEWIDEDHSIVGIQWHPELTFDKHEESLKLFEDLIQRAIK